MDGAYVIVPGEFLPVEVSTKVDIAELSHRVADAPPYVREQLGLGGDQVIVTEQLTSLDGEPLYLQVGYSGVGVGFGGYSRAVRDLDSVDRIPEVATAFRILFDAEYGGYRSVIEAVECDERTAGLLHIAPGSVTLMREMTLFDGRRRPRHVCWTHYRPDLTAMVSAARESLDRTA